MSGVIFLGLLQFLTIHLTTIVSRDISRDCAVCELRYISSNDSYIQGFLNLSQPQVSLRAFTFSLWVGLSADDISPGLAAGVSILRYGSQFELRAWKDESSRVIHVVVVLNGETMDVSLVKDIFKPQVTKVTWRHLALVWRSRGGEMILYLDSHELSRSQLASDTYLALSQVTPINVGEGDAETSGVFTGAVGNLRIFSGALFARSIEDIADCSTCTGNRYTNQEVHYASHTVGLVETLHTGACCEIYTVSASTSDEREAGTDASVEVTLYDAEGNLLAVTTFLSGLATGSTTEKDTPPYEMYAGGYPLMIRVSVDKDDGFLPFGDDLFLSNVTVRQRNNVYFFDVNTWIGDGNSMNFTSPTIFTHDQELSTQSTTGVISTISQDTTTALNTNSTLQWSSIPYNTQPDVSTPDSSTGTDQTGDSNSDSVNERNLPVYVGGGVGGFVLLALISLLTARCFKLRRIRRQARKGSEQHSLHDVTDEISGKHSSSSRNTKKDELFPGSTTGNIGDDETAAAAAQSLEYRYVDLSGAGKVQKLKSDVSSSPNDGATRSNIVPHEMYEYAIPVSDNGGKSSERANKISHMMEEEDIDEVDMVITQVIAQDKHLQLTHSQNMSQHPSKTEGNDKMKSDSAENEETNDAEETVSYLYAKVSRLSEKRKAKKQPDCEDKQNTYMELAQPNYRKNYDHFPFGKNTK